MLQIRKVSFQYPKRNFDRPTLEELSFDIPQGELVAITGPSGSGKSTLLYLLGGLIRPNSGRILLDGHDLTVANEARLAEIRKTKIGFVFQQFHLLPHASAQQNILLPTEYNAQIPKSRSDELIEKLGLRSVSQSAPNQLSGGQQQRVAIGRALLSNPDLILADEPTGALDQTTGAEIFSILRTLAREGKSVILVTHDPKIADACDRTIQLIDGRIVRDEKRTKIEKGYASVTPHSEQVEAPGLQAANWVRLYQQVRQNLLRSKLRSILTLLGVTVGIAAVVAMLSLGRFAKETILSGYESLGVNKLVISGRPNWRSRNADPTQAAFLGFDSDRDLQTIVRSFNEVSMISPVYMSWHSSVDYAGTEIEGARVYGVSEDYAEISNRNLVSGNWILPPHVSNRAAVCVIGSDLVEQLFPAINPIGEAVHVVVQSNQEFMCRVIGTLARVQTNKEGAQPNLQLFVPYTFYRAIEGSTDTSLREFAIQLKPESDFEGVASDLKEIFSRKYGSSGVFRVDSDLLLIAQMKKFLGIFTALLSGIAFLSLIVGGMGVTNLMLVSLSERMRELGLRRAIGATPKDLRFLVLGESIILCSLSGVIGIISGWLVCESLLFIGAQLVPSLMFQWFIDPIAMGVATLATLSVGLLSGLAPAVKAERIDVVEALRSE